MIIFNTGQLNPGDRCNLADTDVWESKTHGPIQYDAKRSPAGNHIIVSNMYDDERSLSVIVKITEAPKAERPKHTSVYLGPQDKSYIKAIADNHEKYPAERFISAVVRDAIAEKWQRDCT